MARLDYPETLDSAQKVEPEILSEQGTRDWTKSRYTLSLPKVKKRIPAL